MVDVRGPRPGDVARLVAAWASSTAALVVTGALLPGLSASDWWDYAAVAAVAGVVGLVLRPVLVELSARFGWLAVLLVALGGQALVTYVAILTVPGIQATGWTALAATWVSAVVGTAIAWATTAGTDDALVTSLARRARRRETVPDPEVDGIVFVQMDGVPFPVIRWAVQSGAVPHIRGWLASGDYALRPWTPQIPCTTPASQLGILHGTVEGIPAFRWYDRDLGRVLVANRPADARVIEERASTGRGLLHDDGVSISNLFSGDAPRSLMTMSRVEARRGSTQTRRAFAWFLASPERLHAQPHAHGRGGRQGAVAGAAPGEAPSSTRASPAAGRSRCCAPSPTPCCGTSTPPWSRRRCAAGRGPSTSTTWTTTRSRTTPASSGPSPSRPSTGWTARWRRSPGSPRTRRGATAWSCCPTTASPRERRSRTATARRSPTWRPA